MDAEHYNANHHFNCDSKCVAYLLTCRVCKKRYVGQTTDSRLGRFRWNNYKARQKKALSNISHTQRYLQSHFLQENHSGLIIQ